MKKTTYTQTTFEIHEVLIVRGRHASESCPDCAPIASVLVDPEDAATLTSTSLRAVFRYLEAGLVHFRELDESKVLVCVNSLGLAPAAYDQHCGVAAVLPK